MTGDCHVQFCEGLRVKPPGSTLLDSFGSGHCNILRIVLRNLGVPKAKSGPKAAGCSWPTDVPGLPFLERLPGTRVYMGGALAGSGDCLNAVFVETSRGPSGHPVVRRVASPQGYTSPCIGIIGGLGKVVGVPSYVESGSVRGSSFDYFIRVTPWRGHNWGCCMQANLPLALSVSE